MKSMNEEGVLAEVHERAVLHKFDGDVDDVDQAIKDGKLLEAIALEDGLIVEHWHKGDETDPPTS
jgi:hypothetical protein